MSEDFESFEQGWPARDFDEDARGYLLIEARQRVQEQLSTLRSQDVKIAALFTASVALFALSGFLGSLRIEATPEAVLTVMAFVASLGAWLCLGIAYWTRETGDGLSLTMIREYYSGSSRQELQEVGLESAVEDFALNQRAIRAKSRWLRWSFVAVATQLLLLFASILASAASD